MSYNVLNIAIFAPVTAVFCVGAGRALMLGVSADADGVTARLLTRTVKIHWSEIESISGNGNAGGGALGTVAAPAIVWKRWGQTRVRKTDLNILGSYSARGHDKPLGVRVVEDLQGRLLRWRRENGESLPG